MIGGVCGGGGGQGGVDTAGGGGSGGGEPRQLTSANLFSDQTEGLSENRENLLIHLSR